MSGTARCEKLDGEYERFCELEAGHDGPHFDGLAWYDDAGYPVPEPAEVDE
jgi:hypothetical protein